MCIMVTMIFCLYCLIWVKQYIFPSSITAPETQIIYDSKKHVVRKWFVSQVAIQNPHPPGVFMEK